MQDTKSFNSMKKPDINTLCFLGIKNTLKLSNSTVNHDMTPLQNEQHLLEKRNFG